MLERPQSRRSHTYRLRERELSWWLCIGLLAFASLLVVGVILYCMFSRFVYPFELSWMEGCFVDHAQRIVDGKPIYCEPSEEFIALLYTPIGHYLTAGLMKLGLGGFSATRAVSIVSLLLTLGLCMRLASRATRHRWLCLAIPGLVAATYFSTDAYYDVGRPDQPMMLFCALAVVALTLRSSAASIIMFVIFALLAYWTKQSVLIFLVILLVGTFFVRRRVAIIGGLSLLAGLVVTVAWAHVQTDGWYSFYVFKIAGHKTIDPEAAMIAVSSDFLQHLAPLTIGLLLAFAAPLLTKRRGGTSNEPSHVYPILLSATAAAAAFSFVSRITVGGAENVLILFSVFGATLLPVVIGRAVDQLSHPLPRAVAWRLAMLTLALVMISGLKDFRPYVPGKGDVETWRGFVGEIEQLGSPDRVWVQYHGAIQTADGPLAPRPHGITLTDYLGGAGRPTGFELPDKLRALIRDRHFDAIIFPAGFPWMEQQLWPNYKRDPSRKPITLPEFSGWKVANEEVWIRNSGN